MQENVPTDLGVAGNSLHGEPRATLGAEDLLPARRLVVKAIWIKNRRI
ncbi:hypothetical protein [Paremcibacter congregatus]